MGDAPDIDDVIPGRDSLKYIAREVSDCTIEKW
jgi:hypothetical protein